jgi:ABC-2 type transport system permease protein
MAGGAGVGWQAGLAAGTQTPDGAGGLMDTLRMYFKLLGISFRSRMQFRADFIVGLVSVIVLNGFSLATIGVILNQFQSLAGWTIWEIVFLYCLWVLGHSLYSLVFWHMADLEYYIIEGTFDMFLVRPIAPFLQFLAREINYTGFADMLVGVVGMGLAMSHVHLAWSTWTPVYLVVVILSGMLIEFSITLGLASIAFWTGRSESSINTIMQVSFVIQRYPLDMYGQWFRIFVTCILPVAFINYYPAKLLLGKTTPADPWYWLSFLPPLVAAILLGGAAQAWKKGIRQYNSTGS